METRERTDLERKGKRKCCEGWGDERDWPVKQSASNRPRVSVSVVAAMTPGFGRGFVASC
jgi:hypothetical protein